MVLTSCFSGACGRAFLSLARMVTGSGPEITYTKTVTFKANGSAIIAVSHANIC